MPKNRLKFALPYRQSLRFHIHMTEKNVECSQKKKPQPTTKNQNLYNNDIYKPK